jgi:hypothetical protein
MTAKKDLLYGFDASGYFENTDKLEALKTKNPKAYESVRKRADTEKKDVEEEVKKLGDDFKGYPLKPEQVRKISEHLSEKAMDRAHLPKGVRQHGGSGEEVIDGSKIPKTLQFSGKKKGKTDQPPTNP